MRASESEENGGRAVGGWLGACTHPVLPQIMQSVYDVVEEAVQHKQTFDHQLAKACEDAYGMKAAWDKASEQAIRELRCGTFELTWSSFHCLSRWQDAHAEGAGHMHTSVLTLSKPHSTFGDFPKATFLSGSSTLTQETRRTGYSLKSLSPEKGPVFLCARSPRSTRRSRSRPLMRSSLRRKTMRAR